MGATFGGEDFGWDGMAVDATWRISTRNTGGMGGNKGVPSWGSYFRGVHLRGERGLE